MDNRLNDFFKIMLNKIWVVLICAIVCLIGAFGLTKFVMKPVFETKMEFMINYSSSNVTLSGANYNQVYNSFVVTDCVFVMQQNAYAIEVSKATNGEIKPATIFSAISFSNEEKVSSFVVTIKTQTAEQGKAIADAIYKATPDYLTKKCHFFTGTVLKSGVEIKLKEEDGKTLIETEPDVWVEYNGADGTDYYTITTKVEQINRTEEPVQISPSMSRNLLLGGIGGIAIGALIVYLLFITNIKVKSEEDLTFTYKLPVLGVIPEISKK